MLASTLAAVADHRVQAGDLARALDIRTGVGDRDLEAPEIRAARRLEVPYGGGDRVARAGAEHDLAVADGDDALDPAILRDRLRPLLRAVDVAVLQRGRERLVVGDLFLQRHPGQLDLVLEQHRGGTLLLEDRRVELPRLALVDEPEEQERHREHRHDDDQDEEQRQAIAKAHGS